MRMGVVMVLRVLLDTHLSSEHNKDFMYRSFWWVSRSALTDVLGCYVTVLTTWSHRSELVYVIESFNVAELAALRTKYIQCPQTSKQIISKPILNQVNFTVLFKFQMKF